MGRGGGVGKHMNKEAQGEKGLGGEYWEVDVSKNAGWIRDEESGGRGGV